MILEISVHYRNYAHCPQKGNEAQKHIWLTTPRITTAIGSELLYHVKIMLCRIGTHLTTHVYVTFGPMSLIEKHPLVPLQHDFSLVYFTEGNHRD
ncbi:hypothetical protein GCM10007877_36460 [Marinibactrum halimedae]|uniref:Uncharacterized protein n=1 Tax=Marinibactrum halimedae TaxID=1444977 RepID=A0AA37TF53_9GAMM|nr:hypothetical protein GCM10007877_36460 [Marinibactrum halimedae]